MARPALTSPTRLTLPRSNGRISGILNLAYALSIKKFISGTEMDSILVLQRPTFDAHLSIPKTIADQSRSRSGVVNTHKRPLNEVGGTDGRKWGRFVEFMHTMPPVHASNNGSVVY